MAGARVTCTDIDTGESETTVIENDFVLVTDGSVYLDSTQAYGTGTVVLTIKRRDGAS